MATPNETLRALRRSRTLTQDDMGRLLGLTKQAYNRFEAGSLRPSLANQIQIAAILGGARDELWPESAEQEAKR